MDFQAVPQTGLARHYRQSAYGPTGRSFRSWQRVRRPSDREAFADGRGDVITIPLSNRIAFPIVFFALELIGAVANKVNPDFRTRELESILRFSDSRTFICPRDFKGFVGMARELRARLPSLGHIVASCVGTSHIE